MGFPYDALKAANSSSGTDPLQRATARQNSLQDQIRSGNLLQDIKDKGTAMNTPKSFVVGSNG